MGTLEAAGWGEGRGAHPFGQGQRVPNFTVQQNHLEFVKAECPGPAPGASESAGQGARAQ